MDDGFGFAASPNGGANMQVGVLTNEATLLGSTVNLLGTYGGYASNNGTDGPTGIPLSNKLSDLMSMGGALYGTQSRAQDPNQVSGYPLYYEYYANVIKSQNHGLTWNSWQAPSVFNAAGMPPSPLGSYQFADANIGTVMFVKYAVDDGTLGYLTAGNRIDGADGWVYMHYRLTPDPLMNGTNEYLMRQSRIKLSLQSTTFQYWVGPRSPAPSDFVNDSNWSLSPAGSTPIYTSTNQVSWADMVFVPALNSYLYMHWYYPSGTGTLNPNNSVWIFLTAPTPAGPWTQFFTQTNTGTGWFHPAAMHRTVATNTKTTNIALDIVYTGSYGNGGFHYHPTYSTLVLNPTVLNPVVSNATLSSRRRKFWGFRPL